ncbi:ABC transporter permease [Georgenia sp. Z1491]|uniref:ABC transporter permease n=1 Tax=Georgenia sp. Z1491 TaxID=3416707 RepID=UPI003CFBAD4D
MTATATGRTDVPPARRTDRPPPDAGTSLTGTATLVRLNLRLDRVRIAVWALAVGLVVLGSVYSLEGAFPTQESLQGRADLMSSPAAVIMSGPAFALDDYTFGAMVANELVLYVLLAASIMSILLAVRHTRAEEESGRLELIRSLPVGRFAAPTASVVTVAVANVLVGAAVTISLVVPGMAVTDSLALGLATALTGMVFAALATVVAQTTEHAGGASGLSAAVLAGAFLVRGIGDVIEPTGSWLSWFSPLAWAQQTRLFVDLRWWPLAVSAAAVVVLYVVAVSLARRRDLGAGLRRPSPGPANAARSLLSPAGLAERLLRGSVIAWGVGTFLFAVAMGSLAGSIDDMLEDNPTLQDWVALEGTDMTAQFAGIILTIVLVAPMILAVSGVLRLKAEESSGRTEQTIVTGSSRTGYLGGWLLTVAVHMVLLTVVSGLGTGIGVALGVGEASRIGELTLAALVYLPAIAVLAGLAVATFGLAPRLTVLAWLLVVWTALVLFLGGLLDIPGWALAVSPFDSTPALPAEDLEVAPLLVLTGIAAVLVVVGALGFRRRDVTSR